VRIPVINVNVIATLADILTKCDFANEMTIMHLHGDSWYILETTITVIKNRVLKILSCSVATNSKSLRFELRNLNAHLTMNVGTLLQPMDDMTQFDCRVSSINGDVHVWWMPQAVYPHVNIRTECRQLESTIGYVEDLSTFQLHIHGGDSTEWSGSVQLGACHMRAHQSIVDALVTTYRFKTAFEEYEMLYLPSEMPVFRSFTIGPLDTRVTYVSKSADYRKILRGNFKSALSLIPPCDMHMVFPEVMIGQQQGWEAVVEAYFVHLLKTQKMRCIKKVVKSFTIYKIKKFYHWFH